MTSEFTLDHKRRECGILLPPLRIIPLASVRDIILVVLDHIIGLAPKKEEEKNQNRGISEMNDQAHNPTSQGL